jgi:hypothetical protein
MKKSIILGLCIIMMMSFAASAQHVNLGVKLGANFYNINNSIGAKSDYLPGFHVGLIGHVHLTDRFGLQPEILFSGQGAKNGNTINLNYVNIPILLQYFFANGFRIQAGPQLGILTSAKSTVVTGSIKDNYKPIDIGLSVGVSYIHVPSSFGVDLRYNHGLTNINETDVKTLTNRGFQLGVFYLFGHK